MTWLGRLINRNALEKDMNREMQAHLDAAIADHMRAGMTRADAVRRARMDFGGPEQMKEETRDARGTRWVEDFVHDCRFAVRGMRRSPAFASAAVLTIAIGVGANTAVWSIMEALMRRALPISHPEQLVALKKVGLQDNDFILSRPVMEQMQKEVGSAAELTAIGSISRVYATRGDERPEGVLGLPVSGNFFDVIGVHALAGRLFSRVDDRALGSSPTIVISEAFWERKFGRDPSVVGSSIRINGYPVTIIGIAEAGFGGLTVGNPVDFWAPLSIHQELKIRGSARNSNGDDRKPWVTQREISWLTLVTRADENQRERITSAVNKVFKADQVIEYANRDSVTRSFGMKERIQLEPIPRGFSSLRTEFRDPLRALLAGVALILLITCANLAGLVLARGEARSHEMAIRSSLGAKSGRLARQLATESLTIAFIGGAIGVVLAQWMIGALLSLASSGTRAIPLDAHLNASVLAFAFGVTLLAGIIVGLAPALRVKSFELYATFKTGGRVASGHRLPIGRLLVAAQIALALILVTSAGVFARTFANFIDIDAGYSRESVVTARIDVRAAGYTTEQLPGEYQRLLNAASGVPGVSSASLAQTGIANGGRRTSGFGVPGRPLPPGQNTAQENYVTPGYFRTNGIRLDKGRDFDSGDIQDRPQVVVVSESFAKHFFGTPDALGKRFGYGDGTDTPDSNLMEVVGIVRDTRFNGLKEQAPRIVFHPLAQGPEEYASSIDVRVIGRPEPVITALRAALANADRNLPVREVVKLGDLIERGLSREKLVARLASSFGILALILAAIGLYGVISYSVARRTNEMGVRLALGASPGGVSWLVLRDSLALVIVGLIAGVALWFPVLNFTRSLLYGVSPHDPRLLTFSLLALVFVGVMAGLIPALRASRIDPIEAIRAD